MTTGATYKIILSGGGTGGHVYPAIAIANALTAINKNVNILFVGALGKMEMQKVPEAGYKIIGLNISGIQRKLSLKNLLLPVKLLTSIIRSFAIIQSFKPDAVIGVGGYASGPILYAASRKKIPSCIQEQNSYAGLTNKWLAKKVDKIFVAYPNMEKYFPAEKIVLAGNPVRQDIFNIEAKRPDAFKNFDLHPDKQTVLMLGGSLGARTINESTLNGLELLIKNNIQLIWPCGKLYHEDMKKKTGGKLTKNIKLLEFITEMDLAYAAADIIISRAGAISISELAIVGKPVILVPSPNVAEDHQTKNAQALAVKNAAIMIHDSQAIESLIPKAIELLNDPEKRNELSKNIIKFQQLDSAKKIAASIIKFIN